MRIPSKLEMEKMTIRELRQFHYRLQMRVNYFRTARDLEDYRTRVLLDMKANLEEHVADFRKEYDKNPEQYEEQIGEVLEKTEQKISKFNATLDDWCDQDKKVIRVDKLIKEEFGSDVSEDEDDKEETKAKIKKMKQEIKEEVDVKPKIKKEIKEEFDVKPSIKKEFKTEIKQEDDKEETKAMIKKLKKEVKEEMGNGLVKVKQEPGC